MDSLSAEPLQGSHKFDISYYLAYRGKSTHTIRHLARTFSRTVGVWDPRPEGVTHSLSVFISRMKSTTRHNLPETHLLGKVRKLDVSEIKEFILD